MGIKGQIDKQSTENLSALDNDIKNQKSISETLQNECFDVIFY